MRPADSFGADSFGAGSFDADPKALAKASDADRVVGGAGAQLNYLSSVSVSLGLPDPVQEYFGPIVGRWRDLHDEAARWRRAAHAVEELADGVTAPLGRLDAVWHGAVSDSFTEHMRRIGKAGTGASDTMGTMADVLDKTAQAMHQLVTDTVDMLAGGADRVSLALLLPAGEERAGNHIAELRAHGRRMLESVHELLEAFARMCQQLDDRQPFADVKLAAAFPEQAWTFKPDLPAVPAASVAPEKPAEPPSPEQAAAAQAAGAGGHGGGHGGFGSGIGAAPAAAPHVPPEPGVRTLAVQPGAAVPGAPTAPAAAAAAAGGGARGGGAGVAGAPFMPMAGMGAGQGGDSERKGKSNLTADPVEIFGKPSKTAPPVIGDD